MERTDVLIVGGGVAGLACARRLQAAGVDWLLLEAGDAPGGRARTDVLEGYRLDRGFQVLLTAYPEVARQLDLAALQPGAFAPGALVRRGGRLLALHDPFRHRRRAWAALKSPLGTLPDKIKLARWRSRLVRAPLERIFDAPERRAAEALQARFSARLLDAFFRPFYTGVFLDPELGASSRMLEFTFKMFAQGEAVLPAGGMGAVPAQLADGLPAERIRLNAPVGALEGTRAATAGGQTVGARHVVVATDGASAHRLLHLPDPPAWRAATCFYFAAEEDPIGSPSLVLNAEGVGPINTLCFPSAVCPGYAPPGRHLLSVSVPGRAEGRLPVVRAQLVDWFGPKVEDWRLLRAYEIAHALPARPSLTPRTLPLALGGGRFVCGDHRETPSLNGALRTGRLAAEQVLAELKA